MEKDLKSALFCANVSLFEDALFYIFVFIINIVLNTSLSFA